MHFLFTKILPKLTLSGMINEIFWKAHLAYNIQFFMTDLIIMIIIIKINLAYPVSDMTLNEIKWGTLL